MFDIDREHPEYARNTAMWKRYRDLYVGGEQMRAAAASYLLQRNREPLAIYSERLSHVYYENYIGSIIDWYAATLFRREPILHLDGAEENSRSFFATFMDDCDLRGTSFTDFFRSALIDALVCGRSYALIDFPRATERAANRAIEDQLGMSRAYLVSYAPEQLINWSLDEHGGFEWVVLKSQRACQPSITGDPGTKQTRWVYYDKQRFRIYSHTEEHGKQATPAVVDEGYHGLARQRRVPLAELRAGDGLWLMNRAGSLQLEHFNKSNALSWALTMGLFATPVVYSARDFKQVMGESYYIQLGPEDRFGWTEPEGKVYQIAADNLTRLQNEIYRVCYALNQAGNGVTLSQSGLSKQRDFAVTQEVLRAYGDVVKDSMKRVLRWIAEARSDNLTIDLSGLDEFDIGDFSAEIADATQLLDLGIYSPTLRKQIFKKLALKYLCDVRQDLKDQISAEIESGIS
ncbi:MAG: hypothetical protein IT160_20810 [Bryobacterales bacterium]|nr:hypothetical protein [Bryobacterales bacterium]